MGAGIKMNESEEGQATVDIRPVASADLLEMDFRADAEVVRLVAEGERLTWGHLFNPAFATETSMVDPLPHQRIAVYEHMLPQSRLRFLLADDAGAGKTIMTGLYVREMLTRRLIRRVLIVPPAGLVGNWQREMQNLFSLKFSIASGADARNGNPFIGEGSDLRIVSVDTLAGERMFGRLREPDVVPYDLVVFDEAHKLSCDRLPDLTLRKTARYCLAEALAGVNVDEEEWRLDWSCHHFLLLTATPHMGKPFPYYALWRLLEPEVLSTEAAFHAYPSDARRRHFIRRTKEEMVTFDGARLYKERDSNTFSYELTEGEISEQALYNRTTEYIQHYYNRARILNRSAARLAMSVFQRRLASSSFALMRSFDRRVQRLEALIDSIRKGKLTMAALEDMQRRLGNLHDPEVDRTADEEDVSEPEANEKYENEALKGVAAVSVAELEAERQLVKGLFELAKQVYDLRNDSKFNKLREVLRTHSLRDEKFLIFTEHRDTLVFIVGMLEEMGHTGQIARIHGGLEHSERDEQVEFFRKPIAKDGARYMVCTDAAAEGINLQFCWLMVNYDIPWNPARLEQRMGRIHRYKQQRDVMIFNLVAGKTREGRVIRTLLTKMEAIRKELHSDKVFDVIGRLFQEVSLKAFLEEAITEEGVDAACKKFEGTLTPEQVQALADQERRMYGDGGDVINRLADLRSQLRHEQLRALLPGYVRRYLEKGFHLLDLGVEGSLDGEFALRPLRAFALDPLLPALEAYPPVARNRLTIRKPPIDRDAIFVRPGEPFFDRLQAYIGARFHRDALRGALFCDPLAREPYLFHIGIIHIRRTADPRYRVYAHAETLDAQLIGLRSGADGVIAECPVEHLLLLKGLKTLPPSALSLLERAVASMDAARRHSFERIAVRLAEDRRRKLEAELPQREAFIQSAYAYQETELYAARTKLSEKARTGDPKARGDLTKLRDRQKALLGRRAEALAVLRREPELITAGQVDFIAHALVVPSNDPEDRKRYDAEVEMTAMRIAWIHEESEGRNVIDVHTPELARAANLRDYPGFDLLSRAPNGNERFIEVKGRAAIGSVELTENEWPQAVNHRALYWLYVVYNCAAPSPRLLTIQDPFGTLLVTPRGGVVIEADAILQAAERAASAS